MKAGILENFNKLFSLRALPPYSLTHGSIYVMLLQWK